MRVINTETGKVSYSFEAGTTREAALEMMAKHIKFSSVEIMTECLGGLDHLRFETTPPVKAQSCELNDGVSTGGVVAEDLVLEGFWDGMEDAVVDDDERRVLETLLADGYVGRKDGRWLLTASGRSRVCRMHGALDGLAILNTIRSER